MSGEKILEIGAGSSPARFFYSRFNNPEVTFVGAPKEGAKFNYELEFPGSVYFAVGFLHFVNNLTAASTYDYVIASNVLNLPYEHINASKLARGAKLILKPRGLLIVQNTADLTGQNVMNRYAHDIQKEGFSVLSYFVNERPVPSDVRSKFVNPTMLDAGGRGFSIHATK